MQQHDGTGTQSTERDVPETDLRVLVSASRAVDRELMRRVEHQVRIVLPKLLPEERYTLRMLCAKAFWDGLSRGEKIDAGVAMAHLVSTNALPLTYADRTRSNSIQYRLI